MNNSKMDYGKKYHYIIKYMFMAIPLLLLLLCYLFPTKSITNTYALEETTTTETETIIDFNQLQPNNNITFSFSGSIQGYQRLNIASIDITIGHTYLAILDIETNATSQLTYSIGSPNRQSNLMSVNPSVRNYAKFTITQNVYDTYIMGYDESYLFTYRNFDDLTIKVNYYNLFDLTQMGLDHIEYDDFIKLFPIGYYTYNQGQDITLSTLTIINNVGNNAEQPLQSDEIKQPNLKYINPLNYFYKLNINSWYDNLLLGLHLNLDDDIVYYLYHIPLYLLYLYMFDLILDVFGAIFRIAHRFIIKFGGDY